MALALCLTLLPTAALADEAEGTAQTPPAVEESAAPANGEEKQENRPAEAKQEDQPAAPEQENQPAEAKQENQPAAPEQENQQEDSTVKQDEAVATVQAMIDDLPDAEELDGMDDEALDAVYEAFQTACDAYYDTLTEEQQAQLENTEKLETLSDWFSQSAALAVETHEHYLCGGTDCNREGHGQEGKKTTFEPWTGSATTTGGAYYLTSDISGFTVPSGVNLTLCLNGYNITSNGVQNEDVITVEPGATFTLCDCKRGGKTGYGTIGHRRPDQYNGSGVTVENGTFNMYGGKIANNTVGYFTTHKSNGYGGGVLVFNKGIFNMIGGEITGNRAKYGSGVSVGTAYGLHDNTAEDIGGTFNMTGGEISGNFCASHGGGVYACVSSKLYFTVSGSAQITDNYTGNLFSSLPAEGTANNVYLGKYTDNKTGETIMATIKVGTLDSTASIGVTTEEMGQTVATGVSEAAAKCFTSDDSKYRLIYDSGKSTLTMVTAAHSAHPICGETCSHNGVHQNVEWKLLAKNRDGKLTVDGTALPDNVLPEGNYYLADNLELSDSIKTPGYQNVNLDLNGYTLTVNANTAAIYISSGTNFTLCDCTVGQTGKVTHGATFTGRGVYVATSSTFTMYGGSITDNTVGTNGNGGGVFVSAAGTFNMYDGTISGNNGANGGGVYLNSEINSGTTYKATFNMYGGTISGNSGYNGGGVYVYSSTFIMTGSACIANNKVTGNSSSGGGVYVGTSANFNMNGGTISGNNSGGYGGGVWSKGTFTMKDGTITQNTAKYGGGGVWTDYYFTVSGNVKITDNTLNTGNTPNNVFLSYSQITIGTEGLEPGAKIGVTKTMNTGDKVVTVATLAEGAKYTPGNIFSDRGEPTGVLLEDGKNGKVVNLYSAMPHEHPICGAEHKDINGHKGACGNVNWTPWDGVSEITYNSDTKTAYVYLTDNAERDSALTVADGYKLYLCLNGHSLTRATSGSVITVGNTGKRGSGATLSLCDCKGGGEITHRASTSKKTGAGVSLGHRSTFDMYGGSITDNCNGTGGGVSMGSNSEYGDNKFNMYGGSITNNEAANGYGDGGGGVHNLFGTFTMYGGSITKNHADKARNGGGGVYLARTGTFIMKGGSITDNIAQKGGGVYVDSTGLTVSGDVKITGNTDKDGEANNVYLVSGNTIRIGGALTGGEASIGVTTASTIANEDYLAIARGGSKYTLKEGDLDAFTSDNNTYGQQLLGNSVVFTKGDPHIHAVCGIKNCKDTGHDNKLWKPILDESGLRNATAGYYYLTNNITLTSTWEPKSGVVLCLNGKSITANGSFNAITVPKGRTFTLTDCGTTGMVTHVQSRTGCGVQVNGGTFKMYGGSISGNTTDGSGGGVCVSEGTFTMENGTIGGNTAYGRGGGGVYVYNGTFKMKNGTISGNSTDDSKGGDGNGGGVYVQGIGGSFNMSGGTINVNTAKSSGGGVFVQGANSSFTMGGNAAISGNTAESNGGGVYMESANGAFTMNGGTISGNKATGLNGYGGGVYVASTDDEPSKFIMNSGTISGNTASVFGGGVYVYSTTVLGGTFTMNGGTISGNNGTYGGGVYVGKKANMTVSGGARIEDNWKKGTLNEESGVYVQGGKDSSANNLYLYSVAIDTLAGTAHIGITTAKTPTAGAPVPFATGATNAALDYTKIFTPDAADQGYVVNKDESGNLFLNAHRHNWTYTANGATITATCDADDCANRDGGSVAINKPAHTTYGDGKEAAATVTSTLDSSITKPTITYKKGGTTLNAAPTDAGTYTASMILGNATASVVYTIAKAAPTVDNFTFTAPSTADLTYNGNAKIAAVKAKDGVTGMGNITVKYFKDDEPVNEAKEVGNYTVKISMDDTGNNYHATTEDLTKGEWKFTIGKGTQTVNVPTGKTIVKNGREVDISDWATVSGVEGGQATGALSYALDGSYPGVTLTEGKMLKVQQIVAKDTPITIKATAAATYDYNEASQTFTVTVTDKKPANLSVSMTGWTYGESANKPGYTVPEGVTATVTYAAKDSSDFSTTVPTNAGNYTVKVQYETDTNVYTGTAEFTISPKDLQQEMLARITGDRYYNGTEQTPDVTVTDGEKTLEKNVDYTVSYSNNINASTPTSQAVATVTGKGNYKGIISTTFVINPVTLSIIGEDKMTATASYGTRVKDIPVSSAKVYYNGANVTIVSGTWKFDGDGMDDIPEVGNTKAYKAVFTPMSGSENYRECFTYIKPSISQAAGSVTDPVAKTNLVYNGEEQALLGTLPASSTGTVQYSLDGTNYTETPPTGKEAGTYTVSYKVVGDKNHLDVAAQSIIVKIEKLAITVTAENKTSRVGQALAELTYTYTPELAAGDAFTGTLETNAHPDATGDYSITQGNLALNENYTIDFRAGTYTVADKQAQSDFRFESIPSAVSKTYGDPDFSAVAIGAAPGSTVTYESSEPAVAAVDSTTGKITIKGAGTAVITAKAAATDEYNEAVATCTLTVEKKSIAIPAADATVFTYNGKPQTYALVENQAYTVSGNVQTDANETGYSVKAALKDTANTQWADGTDADKTYVFTIAPKPLSKVTIGDFLDQTYTGLSIRPAVAPVDGNTALTEDTDYTVSYGANTNVGKATITVTGTGNYTGTVCKEWNIIPAVLTISGVTVVDKTYNGSADATVTAVAFNGLKNGEELVIGTDYEVHGAAFNDENVDAANKVTGTVALKNTEKTKNYTLSSATFEQAAAIGRADYNGTASTTVNIVKGRSTAQTGTLTAADFFPEGQMPAGAAIVSVTPNSGTIIESIAVDGTNHKLNYVSKTNIAAAADESYTVTIATTNYKDITATLTFHPTDKLVQDGFKFENGSVTKTYGDEDFTLTTIGEVKGSTVTYESSEPAVAAVDSTTGKITIKGAGTAVITAKAAATDEYNEAVATCTLTVEKKSIAIPAADATVFTYNGKPQTYALVENQAYTVSGNVQTDANETGYSVKAALKDTANTQWADGMTADKTYTFVIGKAVITVTAKDQTAYVGDKAPELGEDSYTVSGLVGEEKLTTQPTVKYVDADGNEIAPDMTKTGEVKILADGAVASGNYTIRYKDGKLTVSTRPSSGGGSSRPSTNPVQTEMSKDPDGTVSLSKTSAAKGDKVTITVKPERHYEVDEVIVRDSKGKQLAVKDNCDGTYTFEMPADKVTVEPTFTWVNPFADVANNAYYVDAVEWMLKREVTQGTTETTFSPNLNCTRAQIVTFLWRAAGSPEPKGTVSFADVSAGSYYAKAVAWAIENGITGGTGDGLFSPNAACTRAQSAAFLYRAAGSPTVGGSSGFSDVAADAYYASAVTWAKEHGITGGIGGGLFGSANNCTRAQIAAFLWRLYAKK